MGLSGCLILINVQNELTFEDLISQQESSVAPRRKKRAREPDAGTLPAIEGQQTRSQRASDRQKKAQPTEHKKESKHRPSEASSRRPVKRFREVVEGTNRYAKHSFRTAAVPNQLLRNTLAVLACLLSCYCKYAAHCWLSTQAQELSRS